MVKKISNLSKNKKIAYSNRIVKVIAVALASIILLLGFTGCKSKTDNRIIIWTSCSEFAQYAEMFNRTHKDNNAVIVYKKNPAASLPPAKDEHVPDIVIGSWLRNDKIDDSFKSLDYIFDNQVLNTDKFYFQMLEAGKKDNTQYLFPVSFNLPVIMFAKENEDLVTEGYTLTTQQVREIGAEFNTKNYRDLFRKIGFTPLSNEGFLYLSAKLYGADFRDEQGKIVYNSQKLDVAADELKDWVVTENTSAQVEEDFAFKYLYMPDYRRIKSGKTLFAYTTSDKLFKIMKEQDSEIDYRWVAENSQIPIEDSFVMMGIYKKSENQIGATEFIKWFFNEENQRAILERKEDFNLDTDLFGIAGGFSTLKDVTEHVLPTFYTQLLTNIPPAQMLSVPNQLPPQWDSYKEYVVDKYLRNYIWAREDSKLPTIPELEKEWRKKVFN